MQRLNCTLVFLTLFASAALSQAQVHCDEPEVDVGEVRAGAPLSHRFNFVNRGKETIEITDVRPSCGCLSPKVDKRRYAPGESGFLFLEVATLTQAPGPNAWKVKLITKTASNESASTEWLLRGRVRREIMLEPTALIFSTDAAVGHDLTLTDYRAEPLKVKEVRTTSPKLTVRSGEVRKENGCWVRPLRLEAADDYPEGRHDESLQILTDDPAYPELRVPVTVVKRSKRGVTATPAEVAIEALDGRPAPSFTVRLRSADDQPVLVDRVEISEPALQCRWAAGPNAMATLKVLADRTKIKGDVLRSIVHVHVKDGGVVSVPVTVKLK
jgi:hypothetical protein